MSTLAKLVSFGGRVKHRLSIKPLILAPATVAIAFMGVVISVSEAQAALLKSYDFNGSLSDTLGNGVPLTSSGGSISGGRYSFSDNEGLRLTSALPSTTDYGIETRLRVDDSVVGYNKLIDFQDLSSDLGLYIFNGQITFYTLSSNFGSVSVGTDFTLGLARSAGSIQVFLDGVSLFTVADASNQAVPLLNVLNFFIDDNTTGQRESFAGSVDFIRIHNDSSTFGTEPQPATVPEPTSLAFLGAATAMGFGASFRRKLAEKK